MDYRAVMLRHLTIERAQLFDAPPCLSGWVIRGHKKQPLPVADASRLTVLLAQVACIAHGVEVVQHNGTSIAIRMNTRLKKQERDAFIKLLEYEFGVPIL